MKDIWRGDDGPLDKNLTIGPAGIGEARRHYQIVHHDDGPLAVKSTDGVNPRALWVCDSTRGTVTALKTVEDDLAWSRRNGRLLSSREIHKRYVTADQMLDTMEAGHQ